MFENLSQDLKDLSESFIPYQEIHSLVYSEVLGDIKHRGYFTNKCLNLPSEKGVHCSNIFRLCKHSRNFKRIVGFGYTHVNQSKCKHNRKIILLTRKDFEEVVGRTPEYHFKNHTIHNCQCRKAGLRTDKNNILRYKNKLLDIFRLKVYIRAFIYIV